MTISTLKDLSKLMDLCRKKGVDHITIDNIQIKLGEIERPQLLDKAQPDLSVMPNYSPEDILNWSAGSLDGVG